MSKTLEQILDAEKARRTEGGEFGIAACKDSILFYKDLTGQGLYTQLELYVDRANRDPFFNRTMILACWELINNR